MTAHTTRTAGIWPGVLQLRMDFAQQAWTTAELVQDTPGWTDEDVARLVRDLALEAAQRVVGELVGAAEMSVDAWKATR